MHVMDCCATVKILHRDIMKECGNWAVKWYVPEIRSLLHGNARGIWKLLQLCKRRLFWPAATSLTRLPLRISSCLSIPDLLASPQILQAQSHFGSLHLQFPLPGKLFPQVASYVAGFIRSFYMADFIQISAPVPPNERLLSSNPI